MKKRMYYWIKGAPKERLGGPWWYKDFTDEPKLKEFLGAMLNFLFAYAIDSTSSTFPDQSAMGIEPPDDVKIIYT